MGKLRPQSRKNGVFKCEALYDNIIQGLWVNLNNIQYLSHQMYLKERIRIASDQGIGSNCIETALFWFGITPRSGDEALPKPDFLEKHAMQRIDKPELGCAVTFTYETYSGIGRRVAHMGAVVESNPKLIFAHRVGSDPQVRFDNFEQFLKQNYIGYGIEYHRPQPPSTN